MFFQYFIVDKDAGIIESLKLSSAATEGVKWQLILMQLVIIAIAIAGFIVLIVGLLVAIPIGMITTAAVYRQLSSQSATASK
jgi:uncharacterized membrane protein